MTAALVALSLGLVSVSADRTASCNFMGSFGDQPPLGQTDITETAVDEPVELISNWAYLDPSQAYTVAIRNFDNGVDCNGTSLFLAFEYGFETNVDGFGGVR